MLVDQALLKWWDVCHFLKFLARTIIKIDLNYRLAPVLKNFAPTNVSLFCVLLHSYLKIRIFTFIENLVLIFL